jgi:drug/metabolite transporter (DMT)-like permease
MRWNSWIESPPVSVLFVSLATLWGTGFVAIDAGLTYFPPVLYAAVRYGGAGAILLGAAAVRGHSRPRGREQWTAVLVVGTLVVAGYNTFLYLGQQYVSGATAAVVLSLSPVLTAVLSAPLLNADGPGRVGTVGLACGVGGVTIVADPSGLTTLSSGVAGMGLVLVGTTVFALGTVLLQGIEDTPPLPAMQGWGMSLGGALLGVAALVRGESTAAVAVTPRSLAALAYLTIGSSVVGYFLYFRLLERVGPTQINLVAYLEPIGAALAGWVILDETVPPATVAGFLVILFGFALLKREALGDRIFSSRAPDH